MKKIYIRTVIAIIVAIIIAFFYFTNEASAQTILQGFQGGTGKGNASVTGVDIGKCLTVSNNAPLTYAFATCGGAGGVAWGAITGTLTDQTDLATALNGKQPLDSDLTTIAGLTATTDNFIQSKAGAWASRTIAQVKSDLGLTGTNSGDQTTSGTSNRISVTNGSTNPVIDISASYVGQSSITTLGTITTGVWNGTAIANANLANSTISGISLGSNLNALTATNSSLTFSGSYDGSTARTVGLNLANANTWTGKQTFNTSAPRFGTITGSTQCLHVDTNGDISGTGSDCGAGSGGLTVGTTTVASGADTKVLFDNAGTLGEYTISGSGNVAMTTNGVFTTPNLGTPSALTLTNATGLPIAGITGLGTGVGTWLATPSSANLITAVTDETGSGALVFGTTPTISTPVLNGTPTGTGVATGATASTLALRDSNGNITANNWLGGYTTTATAAGTTTLTVGSTYLQFFTGSTTQTVTLPVVSTLVLGTQYIIVNNSSGAVTVNSSGGNAVVVLAGGTSTTVTSIATSGTGAAVWSSGYIADTVASGKKLTVSNTLTLAGTDGSTLNIGAGGTLGSAAFTASSAYEVPLTFSTGLTRSTNTITVNTTQNIAKLSNLTSNGLVTTSSSDGTLGVTVPATGILTFLATPSSANLLAAITDETGTGKATFATAPTFTTSITLSAANIITDTTTGTQIGTGSTQKLGFFGTTPAVQQTGDIGTGLSTLGLVTSGTLAESKLTFTDITTGNASTSNHGFLKKLSNVATQYMDGTGAWSVPAASVSNASTTVAGVVEEATQAEVDAGTAAGGTGARLFVNPSTQRAPFFQQTLAVTATVNSTGVMKGVGASADGSVLVTIIQDTSFDLYRWARDTNTGAYIQTHRVANGTINGVTGLPMGVVFNSTFVYVFYDGGTNVSCIRFDAADLTNPTTMTFGTAIAATGSADVSAWTDGTNFYIISSTAGSTSRTNTVSGTNFTQTATATVSGTLNSHFTSTMWDGSFAYSAWQNGGSNPVQVYKITTADGSVTSSTNYNMYAYSDSDAATANVVGLVNIDSKRMYMMRLSKFYNATAQTATVINMIPITKN